MKILKLILLGVIAFSSCINKTRHSNEPNKAVDTTQIIQVVDSALRCETNTIICDTDYEIPFAELMGFWRKADCGPYIDICKTRSICEVTNNQIVIFTILKQSSRNKYNIYYHSICDLGRGGANMDWDNFSQTTPIAKIHFRNDTTADIEWLGFFDKKKGRYVWTESDFNDQGDEPTARLNKEHLDDTLKEWKESMRKKYDGY